MSQDKICAQPAIFGTWNKNSPRLMLLEWNCGFSIIDSVAFGAINHSCLYFSTGASGWTQVKSFKLDYLQSDS